MNKLIFFFIFSMCSIGICGQTISKNPGDFHKVRVFDQISVRLIPAQETKVEIKGLQAKEVQILNKDGNLTLRLPPLKLLQGETVEAVVYFKKLESIEANEGTFVRCGSEIEAIIFKINVKEGADVGLYLKTSKTEISLASRGVLKLTGNTDFQDITMKAGGTLEAKEFITKQTTITLNAGGNAYINASEYVDAKVRAGGTIYIHGKPKLIDQKTIIAGNIIQVD
jgi:hypothetical protein